MEHDRLTTVKELGVHILYMREAVDRIERSMNSKASKRELGIHRWLLGLLFSAVATLGCKLGGLF